MLCTMQGLWIGSCLGPMEQVSIHSFMEHGHGFDLYTYGPMSGVPIGVNVRDAGEIIPRSLYDYSKFSSLAAFSDFFRWKLLLDRGGWWSDLDAVCMRAFDFADEIVLSSEAVRSGGQHTNCGNIKAPAGAEFLQWLWETCQKANVSQISWATVGPALIKQAASKFGLGPSERSPDVFCPVPWWNINQLIDASGFHPPRSSYAVHLWHAVWVRNRQPMDAAPPASFYGNLLRQVRPCSVM